jgi:hypothetical protein
MAQIAGNNLHLADVGASAGAAFPLNTAAWEAEEITLPTGSRIWLTGGSRYVNVTLPTLPSLVKLPVNSHEAVQSVLDLLSVQRRGDYSISSGLDRCLLWWRDRNLVRARYYSLLVRNFRVSLRLTVLQANNAVSAPQPPPVLPWEPAFRYYRYAQLAEDVFESYRNLYLAFESVLSTYIPSAGAIGDRNWTKQALMAVAAGGFDLSPYVPPRTVHVVDVLFREQYEAHRCALFHAKTDQKPLLPGYIADRQKVLRAHARLSDLMSRLLSHRFSIQQQTGGITPYGFSAPIQALAPKVRLGVTATPAATEPQSATTIGQRTDISRLNTQYKGAVDEEKLGREHEFRGHGQVAQFLSPLVNSILFWASEDDEGENMAVEELDLSGVDAFDVRLTFIMNNRQMPRRRFTY